MYIVLCTVPANVTGILLTCEVMDQINQCTMEWNVSGCSPYTYVCTVFIYVRTYICKYVTYVYTYVST